MEVIHWPASQEQVSVNSNKRQVDLSFDETVNERPKK